MRRIGIVLAWSVLQAAQAGCGSDDQDAESWASLFSPQVTEVAIEVDYQVGAQPFTGDVANFGDLWQLFRANAEALFSAAPKILAVDSAPEQMQPIDGIVGQDFAVDQLLALADQHRDERDSATRRTFYVLFLDGYLAREAQRQPTVLGVSIGDTGVIAMFKPVIDAVATARFVEQTTLVHEFGHAAGLVDNGLAMTRPHQDADHGAHCDNSDCVMHYLNEGAKDLVGFVRRVVKTESTVLFDGPCLDDARAAASP
jgi:hypothetical protein